MATTRSLNSDDSVYVTTFAGKDERSYIITQHRNHRKVSLTVTEEELFKLLRRQLNVKVTFDDGIKPSFEGR